MRWIDFNDDWIVRKDGVDGSSLRGPLTLPDDAMMYEQRQMGCANKHNTGYYPGGVYRYRKRFFVPAVWVKRSIYVFFEGVYHRCRVYINGQYVGGRPSGYVEFQIQLQDFLTYGSDNLMEVVADTTDEPNSRWYTGSGIYRPVHLIMAENRDFHIRPQGIRIRTDDVRNDAATVTVSVQIAGDAQEQYNVQIDIAVEGEDTDEQAWTHPVARSSSDEGCAYEDGWLNQTFSISHPRLWSPGTPQLYRVRARLLRNGSCVDDVIDRFGVRIITLDAEHGFRLNGSVVKLRGTNIHHDNGVIGAHTLDAAEERRVRILKGCGYNCIRSAHNPVSRAMLRACDRLGMLLIDELTDVWVAAKTAHDYSRDFPTWWKQDLEAIVERNHNHPSVIMMSIGNEIGETGASYGIEISRQMSKYCRKLDPTRFVTQAVNGTANMGASEERPVAFVSQEDKVAKLNFLMGIFEWAMPYMVRLPWVDTKTRGVFDTIDVAGYNYMYGRYAKDVRLHPGRIILGTETFPGDLIKLWPLVEQYPQIIGDCSWAGWDYIGEAGIATPCYNQRRRFFHPYPALLAGTPIIDITGHRQTQSYVNEFVWGLRTGVLLAVRPVNRSRDRRTGTAWRSTDSIRSWSWPGFEGIHATVEVWSDAYIVELWLNDRKIGSKRTGRVEGFGAIFTLPYQVGTLRAIAFDEEGKETSRDAVHTADDILTLRVIPEKGSLVANGKDLLYVPILLADGKGETHVLKDRMISLVITGPGEVLGFGSAEPTTIEGLCTGMHSTYHGRSLAVIRAGHERGIIQLRVEAEGCEPAVIDILVN